MKIQTALLSVSDKSGVLEFARALHQRGVRLLSTGGTAELLTQAGLPVTEVAAHTGSPEMLDGRIKTLHPKIHGGLLARRDNEQHLRTLEQHSIDRIDLLVVNLYPFRETISQQTAPSTTPLKTSTSADQPCSGRRQKTMAPQRVASLPS